MKSDVLSPGEQKEIRAYVRARINGYAININKLPQWLADLENLRKAIEKIENIFLLEDDNPPEEPDMRIWNIIRDAQGKPR